MTGTPGSAPVAPNPASSAAQASAQAEECAAPDEAAFVAAFDRLKKRATIQAWGIVVLGVLLAGLQPLVRPVYLYYAMNPEKQVMQLSGLDMPNMTNRAILSWATTSITEVMTMGFGDMDVKLPKLKPRFTQKGWEAYLKYFIGAKIGETFKQSQLVLTTVPSNTPVIVNQGINVDDTYEWIVQMPVIMTYATNNNVMEKKSSTVTLTIVRVPAEENNFGIAIHSWTIE